MSLKSKWKQFVNWVEEHKKTEFDQEFTPEPQVTDWKSGETAAKEDEFQAGGKYWSILGLFMAGYYDEKLGGKTIPPNSGPVTGNNDTDAVILTGGLLVGVYLLFSLVKKLF